MRCYLQESSSKRCVPSFKIISLLICNRDFLTFFLIVSYMGMAANLTMWLQTTKFQNKKILLNHEYILYGSVR